MIPNDVMVAFEKQQEKLRKASRTLALADHRVSDNAQRGLKYQYTLQESVFFDEAVQSEQQVSFAIPEAHGIWLNRVALYPSARFFTTDEATNGPDEVSYRPCLMTSGEHVMNPFIATDNAVVDLRVSISESFTGADGNTVTRDLQNGPLPSKLFFSDSKNYRANSSLVGGAQAYASFDHGKGLYFVEPWFLPRGSTVTFKVAPVFASLRVDPVEVGADVTRKNQYKVDIILDGFKRDAT